MNLISTEEETIITQAMDDLWDTVQSEITIVKAPTVAVTDLSGVYVPGFGETCNPSNFEPISESKTFFCLTVEKHPYKNFSFVSMKVDPEQVVLLKVKQEARDYIRDGRPNLHAIFEGRKYKIPSNEEVAEILSNRYYVFKMEVFM